MSSIFDGAKYLYAEQLKGKRVKLIIKCVRPVKIVGDQGRESMGFEVEFEKQSKMFAFAGATVRRQIALATGTDDPAQMAGKEIELYPVPSKRSVSGQAIRVAIPEHMS